MALIIEACIANARGPPTGSQIPTRQLAMDTHQRVLFVDAGTAFYRIEQHLDGLGFRRYSWETLSVWLSRIERTAGPTVSLDILHKSLALHYRYRFDPRGLSASEKSQMTSMISAWFTENHLKSVALKKNPDP